LAAINSSVNLGRPIIVLGD